MTSPDNASDFLAALRERSATTSGVFRLPDNRLAIFEPGAARRVAAENWRDIVIPDRLVDLLRRRPSPAVPWRLVRREWLRRQHTLITGPYNEAMSRRMAAVLDAHCGQTTDLTMLAQETAVCSLLPVVVAGLSARDTTRLQRDLHQKVIRLIALKPRRKPWQSAAFLYTQIRAGRVIRHELRHRSSGTRARQVDLTDPLVDMLDALGPDRAMSAIMSVLTAIAGPPGAAAGCLLYALQHHPEWADRITAELAHVDDGDFFADPVHSAPVTVRVVKEVLRLWTPPLLLAREARRDFDIAGETLRDGDGFLLSPHMIHRDPRFWRHPDEFHPDRWLPGSLDGPTDRWHYVPFGWAPKSCIGADVGTVQLVLFAHLVTTRYRIQVADGCEPQLVYRFVAVPQDFRGMVVPRQPRSHIGHLRPSSAAQTSEQDSSQCPRHRRGVVE